MLKILKTIIECDEDTCFCTSTQRMCPQVLTTHFGTRWVCGHFRDKECNYMQLSTEDDSPGAMLQRLKICKQNAEDLSNEE